MLLRLLLTIFLLGLGPLPAAAATGVVLVGQVSHVSDGGDGFCLES
jgi:hypothetical protein